MRVFKIGSTRVMENESMQALSNEAVREQLRRSYPEVANATLQERVDAETGLTVVEFLPQPGRKG